MNIGVFSKFAMAGGSEFRAAELATGISKYVGNEAFLLAEGDIPDRVLERVGEKVHVVSRVLTKKQNVDILYEMDCIIVVNTDCTVFTSEGYWSGNTGRHGTRVDLARIRKLAFIFNFIVSPATKLISLAPLVDEIFIVTTNRRFFYEISDQERYAAVRHLPRLILESPIDQDSMHVDRIHSETVRIGQYSMSMEQKFNEEIVDLVERLNRKFPGRIEWRFMGMPESRALQLAQHANITFHEAFSIPVQDFLQNVDVFLFYPSWKRQEPWSRSIGEAMASGCPVVATKRGGNEDQIVHGNSGFLCNSIDDFDRFLSEMIENAERIHCLGRNARRYARFFNSQFIVQKLMEFIQ